MDTTTMPETRLLPAGEGEWAGWLRWPGTDPFEDHAGPFFARHGADGAIECGFRPDAKNRNGGGNVHGGALLTFADFSLFMIASAELPAFHGVTATLNAEFVGAAQPGRLLTARGEVVKAGRSLIFVRGTIDDEGAAVMSFQASSRRSIDRRRARSGALARRKRARRPPPGGRRAKVPVVRTGLGRGAVVAGFAVVGTPTMPRSG